MRIRTGLRSSLHFSFEQPDWYGVISQELAQVVEAMPIWSLFGFIEAPDAPSEPLTPASFDRIVRNPKNQGWELSALQGPAGQLGGRGDVSFECTVHDDWLILRVTLLDAAFQRFATSTETILAPFLGAFGRPLLLSVSGARPWFDPDLPWQKLRPRPPATYLAYENVVDVFDSRLPSAWADREGGPVAERILAAPVPVGVRKVERDGKVLFFWTDTLTDPDALAAARMRHERWLAELVRPGSTDRRLEISSQDEAPPLSFVDRESRLGFKTVVVFPDGSVEQPAWDAALAVARTGHLAGVYLIVPLRDQALALRERAVGAGFAGVGYPSAGGISVAGESV